MHVSNSLAVPGLALLSANIVQAKAVFAHYMVGGIEQEHAQQDIDDAIAMGLDGFALNIGDATQEYVATALDYLFEYATNTSFKLFISMDLSASGAACTASQTSCNGPYDYSNIFTKYLNYTAWYLGPNGHPMISTFTSGGFTNADWTNWKNTLASKMYFVPDFDDTAGYYEAAAGWWSYWGDVVDGLFSWEPAWPLINGFEGSYPGDIGPDIPVINGTAAHRKGYMIALSALLYKDAYDTNDYRAGDLNLPTRMQNILEMSPQPNFVEIITWNDGPESHYIGNIWPESNSDPQPAAYATQTIFPHKAWEPLISPFIKSWKAGGSASYMSPPPDVPAVGAIWYKTILQNESCPSTQPEGFDNGTDSLNWALVLGAGSSGVQIRATSNDVVLQTVGVDPGLNYGSPKGLQYGAQMLELLDTNGKVVMSTGIGGCVTSDCPNGIYNMNYQVIGLGIGSNSNRGCFDVGGSNVTAS